MTLPSLRNPGKHIPTLWLVVALVLIKGILFIALLPPWQGPDEPVRFEAMHLTTQSSGILPSYGKDASIQSRLVDSMRFFRAWKYYNRQEPPPEIDTLAKANLPAGASVQYETPAGYALYGLFFRQLPAEHLLPRLYAARMVSLLLHLLCVLLMAWMLRHLFDVRPDHPLCLVILMVYGLHPQLSFLASSAHIDNLGFLSTMAILSLWIAALKEVDSGSKSYRFYLLIFAAALLSALSVYTVRKTISLLPFGFCVVPFLLWNRWKERGRLEAISSIGFLFFVLSTLLAVYLYHYPQVLDGSRYGYTHPATLNDLLILGAGDWLRYFLVLFATFWMALGSLVYKLSPGWLLLLGLLTMTSTLGWIGLFTRPRPEKETALRGFSPGKLGILALYLFWLALSVGIAYGPHRPNPEGRYLLAAMLPLVLLGTLGLLRFRFFFRKSPEWFLLSLLGTLALLLNSTVVLGHLIPIFYLP